MSEPTNSETTNNSNKDPPNKQKQIQVLKSEQPDGLHVVTEDGQQCFMWRSNQLTYIAPNRNELPLVLATKFGPIATKLDLSYNNLTSFRNINLFSNLNELILDNNCLGDNELEFRQNLRLKTLSLNKNKLCDLYKLIISIKVSFPNLEFLSLIGNPFYPIKIITTGDEYATGNSASPVRLLNAKASTTKYVVSGRSSSATIEKRYCANESQQVDLCDSIKFGDVEQQQQQQSDHDKLTDFNNQIYRYFIINHLPNLNFLNSNPISSQERDEALNCSFWLESFTDRQTGQQRSIICGQTMQNSSRYDNIDNNKSNINGRQLMIRAPDSERRLMIYHREGANNNNIEKLQLQLYTANGENQPKGQLFSRQVKCQMVGGFTFARTLLWTLISLTSTNLVHCSGALLALTFKGTGSKNRQLEKEEKDGKKRR